MTAAAAAADLVGGGALAVAATVGLAVTVVVGPAVAMAVAAFVAVAVPTGSCGSY